MIEPSDFFTVGGTLRTRSPSYVTRPADQELWEQVTAGEFCYILTPRQMGKSSLMVRTARRLRKEGVKIVQVDLTSIGTVSIDEWYLGLLTRIRSALRLRIDVQSWWLEQQAFSASQRFGSFLQDVVLAEVSDPMVIFIDEIDSTLKLEFRDDFFAVIRACYNARASHPIYKRLTFVLLGVATPTDLIQDRDRTPFNIGRQITLKEFSYEDAQALKEGLEIVHASHGDTILSRIFYWTNGHPYLTQKLCLAAAETPEEIWHTSKVDALVEHNFFSEEARKDTNLTFVSDRIQASSPPERRRMLKLYRKVYNGATVRDDDRSPIQNNIELFGLVRVEKGALHVRNEIYRRVFDQEWIKSNMPDNRSQWLAIGLTLLTLFLLVLSVNVFIAQPDVELLEERFLDGQNSETVRIEALGQLFEGNKQRAVELFYEVSSEEQDDLFFEVEPQSIAPQLVTVVKGIYVTIDWWEENEDTNLMEAMIYSLNKSNHAERTQLIEELTDWKDGRLKDTNGQYEDAVKSYTNVLNSNNDHPVVHYDRALAYLQLGRYEDALADLNETVRIADTAPPTPTPTPTPDTTNTPTPAQKDTPRPTETAFPTASTTPTSHPSVTAEVSLTPSTIVSVTSTPISTPISIRRESRFINPSETKNTVKNTINANLGLLDYIRRDASVGERYRSLVNLGLIAFIENNVCNEESASGPIKIGAIFELTGETSNMGRPYSEGIKAFVEWKNENCGIEGRQIELIHDDYGFQVPRAEELYTQYVTQDEILAFSGWLTGDTEALKGRISEDKIPFISASYSINLADPAETPYNFLVGTSFSDQLVIAQKWALEDWAAQGNSGLPKFAYLHHDSPFGKSPLPEGEAHAAENGVETLAIPSPGGATDLIPQLTQISDFGANYVFLQNISGAASLAIRNANEQGLDMQFVCMNWCSNDFLISLASDAGEGVVGAIPFAPRASGAEGAKEALAYASEKNITVDDEILFVQGWWSMAILVEGIERAAKEGGVLTGEKVKNAMEGISNFETGGVTAPITFSTSDHRGNKSLKMYRIEAGTWNPITDELSAE